jgi:uncharacterized repeat protein (TIGR03803 family)
MDSQGDLYGTTTGGGNSTGCGTVFEVTPGGTETVLYSFSGPDGCQPGGGDVSGVSNGGPGLVMDSNRNLHGTTYSGGANNEGAVFELSPGGTETVLHSFANNGTDGYGPLGGMVFDSQGNLFGITAGGGPFVFGTIFKVTQSGAESILFNFSPNGPWPVQPGLLLDNQQNLYGTAAGDGPLPGVVFQLSPSGVLTILYVFGGNSSVSDGSDPQGGLLLPANGSPNGSLYGTTSGTTGGGASNSGTVFELSPSVNPVTAPVFSPLPGAYTSPVTVTITDATPGTTVNYTLNGAIANPGSGTFCLGPVTISSTTTLSAIAVAPNGATSDPILVNYVIAP